VMLKAALGKDATGLVGRHLQDYLHHLHVKNCALQGPAGRLLTTCLLLLGYAGKSKQACGCLRASASSSTPQVPLFKVERLNR
jgi:hypothetical protein